MWSRICLGRKEHPSVLWRVGLQSGFHLEIGEATTWYFHPFSTFAHNVSKHDDEWVEMGRLMMLVVVGWCWCRFLGWRMGLVWSQARWFEIPLLDEGDFQPCFGFPHKKEIKTQRFRIENVVELGDWYVSNYTYICIV